MIQPPYASLADVGDQIERLSVLHIDRTFRAALGGEHVSRSELALRVRTGQPHPFGNFTMISDVADLAACQREIDALCLDSVPSAMMFVVGVPAALRAHLELRRFQPHAPMPAMAVEIERLNKSSVPAGCELVPVEAGPQGALWEEVFALGYELPRPVAACFAPNSMNLGGNPDLEFQYFLVTCGGRPVATTAVCLMDGVAGIYCVATLPAERKKGFGAWATSEPLRWAYERGYRVGILQASEAGHPVYRRLGFQEVGAVALYLRTPDSPAAD